jgi:hypothetical protein
VKRKKARWVAKLAAMAPAERAVILAALQEVERAAVSPQLAMVPEQAAASL